jgi:rsbT antagonist protein RsbS
MSDAMNNDRSVTSSIPIIPLWDVLLVPLQGEILDHQVDKLRADVLAHLQRRGSRHLVIDVSGVWLMDSHLCMVVSQISKAARFMGAKTVLTGLSPDVALTLQAMGLHIGGGATLRGLQDALESLGIGPERRAAARGDVDEGAAFVRRLLARSAATVGTSTRGTEGEDDQAAD